MLQQYQAMREALQQEEEQALRCMDQEENRVLGSFKNQLETLQNALMSSGEIINTLQGLSDAQGMSQHQDQAFIMARQKFHFQKLYIFPVSLTPDSNGVSDCAVYCSFSFNLYCQCDESVLFISGIHQNRSTVSKMF